MKKVLFMLAFVSTIGAITASTFQDDKDKKDCKKECKKSNKSCCTKKGKDSKTCSADSTSGKKACCKGKTAAACTSTVTK